jgi:exonuclease SbcD
MRILHTADWHLGDRLGRHDRTADLRRAVERVAAYCLDEKVDVLLVAGDLFHDLCSPEEVAASLEHLRLTFDGFLHGGGTILAITGNHDREGVCDLMLQTLQLAAPASGQLGRLLPGGRFYLANRPFLAQLEGRDGGRVQFLLMPYPTATRYLDPADTPRSLEERNRALQAGYLKALWALKAHERFDPDLRTVLAAHVHVQGASTHALFRLSEREDVVFPAAAVPGDYDYVALGHIHKPQCLRGLSHVRYSGSIERLDLGEQEDDKGVVLVDLGSEGLRGEPRWLPLEATPVRAVAVIDPAAEMPGLAERYPDAARTLVRLEVTYRSDRDNRQAIFEDLRRIFPRCYDWKWTEANRLTAPQAADAPAGPNLPDTVRTYLRQRLDGDPERDEILGLAEEFLAEGDRA